MKVRSNVGIPEQGYENRSEVSKALESIFLALRGETETWTPVVQGGTSPGAASGASMYGYYFRQGPLVDLWYSVTWTGHTGSGDLQIVTPFTAQRFNDDIWLGEAEATGSASFPTGTTYLNSRMTEESNILEIVASGDATASALMQLAGTGSFKGHVRFMIELDGSR